MEALQTRLCSRLDQQDLRRRWWCCKSNTDGSVASWAHCQQDVFSDIKKSGEPAIPNFKDLISPDLPKLDMNEAWDAQRQKWAYQGEYLEQWRVREAELGKEIDAFIAPITPTAAIRHNQFKYYGYASAINLLDWTSVVVPVTFADKDKDKKQTDYKPLSEMDGTVQAECKSTTSTKMLVMIH
jgi:amidase